MRKKMEVGCGEIGWNKMEGGILVSCVSSRRIFAAGSLLHE